MTHLNIEVIAKGDPLPENPGTMLDLQKIVIYEGATGGGRTGLVLWFKDADGKQYYCISTARIFLNGVGGVLRGAMERFGDDPNLP